MDNIVNLIKEQAMNEVTPTPTEKSQIVIAYNVSQPALVVRFSSVKKGQKEYAKLNKAWSQWHTAEEGKAMHDVDGDMFISTVYLDSIASVSFVDHVKRAKFIPA